MAGDGRGGGRPKRGRLPLSALLALFFSLVIVAGCAGGGGEYGGGSGEEVALPVTGSFVGEAPDEE
jgi:hypothetical protein